jgi:hypothetical protein
MPFNKTEAFIDSDIVNVNNVSGILNSSDFTGKNYEV